MTPDLYKGSTPIPAPAKWTLRAWLYATLALCASLWAASARAELPELDAAQLSWLGEQIFRNECNSKATCLTAWNAGEDFPSLGIGHFIWYRAGQEAPFAETFPDLLSFMRAHGAEVPAWIAEAAEEQPWPDREAFLAAVDDPRQVELRAFLANHKDLQTAFIVSRSNGALERILAAAEPVAREELALRYDAVAQAAQPYGMYALIDYVHFKGEGTRDTERYQGTGWGLRQVLEGMSRNSAQPLQDFVSSARAVLARRVALAPPERAEQRWLKGWNARLDTYLPATK
ncbi:MAG: hypothetical protein RLZZ227_1871 [Pseudomonadota bacterium]